MSKLILNARQIHTREMAQLAPTLRAGERVLLSGTVYTARDAAHQRICALLDGGEPLPFPLSGCTVYYAGPTPTPPGLAIGSCGPTTSGRMDGFTPRLLAQGMKCMIGKGQRSAAVLAAMRQYGAVYLCAVGGAGALAARCIKSAEVIAFPELGCESVKRLELENFPLLTAADVVGGSILV